MSLAWRALLLLLLMVPACGGKKSLPKGKLDGLAKTAVAQAPEDTAILFGLSWASAKESRVYPKLVETMAKEPETAGRLSTLEDVCGLDVKRELDSLVVSNNAEMEEKTAVLFIKGNWDEARANECVSAYWERKFFHKVVASKDGNLTTYAVDGDNPKMYAWWPTSDTAMFAPKNLRDKTFITDVAGGQSSVRNNKAFMELLARVDTTATFWLAMSATPALQSALGAVIEGGDAQPLGLYSSVDISNGLKLVLGIRFAAERDAKTIAQKGLAELAIWRDDEGWEEFLRRVAVNAVGRDVVLKWEMDAATLEKFIGVWDDSLPKLGKYIRENLGG
jgi:hypothetical protein